MNQLCKTYSPGGLGVEQLLHKKCHSVQVDRILLGETIPAINMFYVYKAGPCQVYVSCTVPVVPTQGAIPEESGHKNKKKKLCLRLCLQSGSVHLFFPHLKSLVFSI